ncbi:MAG: hypothetical protein V7K38_19115 [Nostoc sp.]|uniref:hypothetical protein n=1 Tax=Nostoc sp. TaxID=1180 RepID=UPI002FFD1BEA
MILYLITPTYLEKNPRGATHAAEIGYEIQKSNILNSYYLHLERFYISFSSVFISNAEKFYACGEV